MRKYLFCLILVVVALPVSAFARDAQLQWIATSGATGYKVSMSVDGGATWTEKDAGIALSTCEGMGTATSCGNYTWTGAPDTGLILFKVGSYNTQGTVYLPDIGVWYNSSWKLPTSPSGVSGK